MGSTMQGIVGGAFEGAGVAIGSLAGGAVYKMEVTAVVIKIWFKRQPYKLTQGI